VAKLVDCLFTKANVDCIVAFLISEEMAMLAEEWIYVNFNETLRKDVEERTIPWAPYFDEDGELDVNLNMPSVKTFGNRMLYKYSAEQHQELSDALAVDPTSDKFPDGFRAPDPTGFVTYNAMLEYGQAKLSLCHMQQLSCASINGKMAGIGGY
jgi:hypothetical protein